VKEKMKKNIFISSTYNDLVDERKAVWGLIEQYEANIKGMEEFGARKETPLETCLNEVSQSDIYIGIIGLRLGSIETKTGKSYTRLEYERAVEEGKEILIYLLDEKNAKVYAEYIDFGEKKEKLDQFKTILKEKHTIDTFKTEDDLVEKLKKRLDYILSSNQGDLKVYDNFEKSSLLIDKFRLLPKTYSDSEILLRVKFKKSISNPYPASQEVCETFGLKFGRTIGAPIEIIEPKVKGEFVNEIFINEDDVEFLFDALETEEYLILAITQFSNTNLKSLKGNFFKTIETEFIDNPNYNFLLPSTGLFNLNSNRYFLNGSNPQKIPIEKKVDKDGRAILILKSVLDKNKIVEKSKPKTKKKINPIT
jgi:hypothetical protein